MTTSHRLQQRVNTHADRLTAADRRLLDVLLNHPHEAIFLAAGEVAARAGVHQATATKLAQRLGYGGYPDLRRDLQSDVLTEAADRVHVTVQDAGDRGLMETLVDHEIAPLRAAAKHVRQQELDRAAELLARPARRYIYGRGNATVLVDLLARRLRRFGLAATALPASGRDLAEELVSMSAGDVLVAFAFRRPPRYLPEALALAREVGAHLILITDTLAPELIGSADVVLAAPRGSHQEFHSLTVPMAITNALVLTIARLNPAQTTTALHRLEALLKKFDR